jgi:hypothetical protein
MSLGRQQAPSRAPAASTPAPSAAAPAVAPPEGNAAVAASLPAPESESSPLDEEEGAAVSAEEVDAEHGHEEEVEEGPGDGSEDLDTTRPVGGVVPNDVRTKILDELKAAPASKETLDAIDKAGKGTFPMKWSKKGTYHSKGEVWIDRAKSDDALVSGVAHEIVHLRTFVEGKAADVSKDSREDFVAKKMDDEINAHATSYVTLLQLGKLSNPAAGYDEFVKKLEKDTPDVLTKIKDSKQRSSVDWGPVKTSAEAFVKAKYETEWVGSKSGENYYEKWGRVWDEAHAK